MSRDARSSTTPEHAGHGAVLSLAFCAGVILLYRLTLWPPWFLLSGILLFSLLYLGLRSRTPLAASLVLIPLGLAIGLLWASWQAGDRLQTRLPSALEQQELSVEGYLCSLPSPGSFDSLRFDFCVIGYPGLDNRFRATALPDLLRLSWYGRDGQSLPGTRLRLTVVLKRPHGHLNIAGFRYEDWLFRHGFRATGSVRDVALAGNIQCGAECRYREWHLAVAQWVRSAFAGAERFPLIASLLIGDRGFLTDQHWQTLKATGTIHLVAISGLHLGLVAVLISVLVRSLLLLLPPGVIGQGRARSIVFGAMVAGCLCYALLAGFSVPTRRALIMVTVAGWSLLRARQVGVWRPYVLALTLVLFLDPFAPLDQGFWLSFGAVGVLLTVFAGRVRPPGWLGGLLIAQLAVFVGLWPLLTAQGQSQPMVGFVANLVAIPWVALVVMPLLLAGTLLTLLSGGFLLPLVRDGFDGALGLLWWWLEKVQAIALPALPELSLPVSGLVAILVLLVLRFPGTAFRTVTALVLLCWGVLLFVIAEDSGNPLAAVPEVRVWDVGQGLSVLVRADNRVLIYDTGPGVEGVYSAVESVLIPGLGALGIQRVDDLVISHADSDHASGLSALVERFPVTRVVSGEPAAVDEHGLLPLPVEPCPSGRQAWGPLVLEFWQSAGAASGNDASCVLRIIHLESGTDVLLPGDISREVELEMLAAPDGPWPGLAEGPRILLAPHHGSKTSSSPGWITALRPDRVIYTAGYRHRYGHPHPDVTRRYRERQVPALNTACSGEIIIRLAPGGPEIHEQRASAPFWISGPGLARDQCGIP